MKLFLTSSPCCECKEEGIEIPCQLNEENDFVQNLAMDWKPNAKGLIITADPDNFGLNDEMRDTFETAFQYAGLSLCQMALCDSRNAYQIQELLNESDFVILGGGHVPTQNAFFEILELREHIQDYKGIIMGISAGSMNSADTVYAQPELEGESVDPDYRRYIQGLGLTDVMILPHYQAVKDNWLDGKRLMEDITYGDSIGNKFYTLVDGSYVLAQNGQTWIYGEAYLIQDGGIRQICEAGGKLLLKDDMEGGDK